MLEILLILLILIIIIQMLVIVDLKIQLEFWQDCAQTLARNEGDSYDRS